MKLKQLPKALYPLIVDTLATSYEAVTGRGVKELLLGAKDAEAVYEAARKLERICPLADEAIYLRIFEHLSAGNCKLSNVEKTAVKNLLMVYNLAILRTHVPEENTELFATPGFGECMYEQKEISGIGEDVEAELSAVASPEEMDKVPAIAKVLVQLATYTVFYDKLLFLDETPLIF